MKIKASKILKDEKYQCRNQIYKDTVDNYIFALRRGNILPPLIVYKSDKKGFYYLLDGWHRLSAHVHESKRLCGEYDPLVECNEVFGNPLEYALGANRNNGLPLSADDKRRAITLALTNSDLCQWSNRALAALIGCSDKTIAFERARFAQEQPETPQPTKRLGRDGKKRKAKVDKPVPKQEPDAAVGDVAFEEIENEAEVAKLPVIENEVPSNQEVSECNDNSKNITPPRKEAKNSPAHDEKRIALTSQILEQLPDTLTEVIQFAIGVYAYMSIEIDPERQTVSMMVSTEFDAAKRFWVWDKSQTRKIDLKEL